MAEAENKKETVDLIDGLKKGLDAVETLMPVVKALGFPDVIAQVTVVASTLVNVAANVKERYNESKIVLESKDKAEIDKIIKRLAKVNDDLAKAIAAS